MRGTGALPLRPPPATSRPCPERPVPTSVPRRLPSRAENAGDVKRGVKGRQKHIKLCLPALGGAAAGPPTGQGVPHGPRCPSSLRCKSSTVPKGRLKSPMKTHDNAEKECPLRSFPGGRAGTGGGGTKGAEQATFKTLYYKGQHSIHKVSQCL